MSLEDSNTNFFWRLHAHTIARSADVFVTVTCIQVVAWIPLCIHVLAVALVADLAAGAVFDVEVETLHAAAHVRNLDKVSSSGNSFQPTALSHDRLVHVTPDNAVDVALSAASEEEVNPAR